ncbi:glycoside hydrolase family 30 protein [Coprinellus micaceus]|uniref:Glycoside hydrolase family 30 protein n=1 Tax=Coprinellus micaceus TaxID=71717 RepID=A0A4Y7THQ1_COPMI|nr:glycoside hydrolase family 30 protein [Coprinellus micaceus]
MLSKASRFVLYPIIFWLTGLAYSQEVWDVLQTTWNRTALLQYQKQSPPIIFSNQPASASANILVKDTEIYQPVLGVGGTLTDSSAQLLRNLKSANTQSYWELIHYMFSPEEGAKSGALSYLRVPLGATDFSAGVYSYDDFDGDLCLNDFTVSIAPDYVFEVLNDIKSVNSMLRVHLLPWSPPAWMKDSGTAFGGSLLPQYVPIYAHYLLKSLQAFESKGILAYAISIQNKPMLETTTHPTARFTPQTEAQVGKALRALMNSKRWKNTKLIGFEQNWDKVGDYPVRLMQNAGSDVFDGVAFHCAAGTVNQQDAFHSAYPEKEIYFTECTGTHGTDWWGDIKWYMDNIFIGSIQHNAQAALMWNLALDGSGNPMLLGASTCGNPGCRGIVTINANGTWNVNQEFYAMAQLAKGTIPRDIGGPVARRIGVAVQGTSSATLRVGAYVTHRAKSTDSLRYSLVVMNWNDSANTKWNPQNVTSTIEFQGKRITYTFPVGVTTLWWYDCNPRAP